MNIPAIPQVEKSSKNTQNTLTILGLLAGAVITYKIVTALGNYIQIAKMRKQYNIGTGKGAGTK